LPNENIPYFILPYFPAGENKWRKTTSEEVAEAVTRIEHYLANVSGCQGIEDEILHKVERVI
jgi:pyruvate formate lyase activating enzyme